MARACTSTSSRPAAELGPADRHPRTPPRTRARRLPARLAQGGPRARLRPPQARPRRWRPARREAPSPAHADLRRRGRAGLDPDAARLAQSEVRQGLDVEPDAVRVPAHWPAAGLRRDERRRDRDAAARLACPPATARRVRERISTVMEWAVAMDLRADNPCDRIGPVLGPQQHLVQHMRALPHRDVAAAIGAVQASGAPPVVKLAFEFLVLTAARSGEVRGAQWAEVDAENHVWTIPATRTKAKAGTPGSPVPACRTDPRRGARARRRPCAGVPERAREAAGRYGAVGAAQGPGDRRRPARLSFELPGLDGRGDQSPARGRRGGARARGPE